MAATLAPPEASQDAPAATAPARRETGRSLALDPRSVAVAAALTALVFAAEWWRHHTFRSTSLDLAVYDQAVWKLAHLQAPVLSTIGWNAFADHFSPVLVAFAPFYRLAATPLWLFGAQALAIGAGFLSLGPLLDTLAVPRPWRRVFSFAYLASPLLWNAALFDFHTTTLAVPFLMVGLRAALLDRRRVLVGCGLALLLLRDDLGLAVAVMALVGWASLDGERRRFRLAMAVAALGWMAGGGAIAAALGSDRHWAFHYGYLAGTPSAAALHPLRTLWRLGPGLARWDNVALISVGCLAPLGFLPALAPRRLALAALPALPLLASASSQFHSVHFHYEAYLVPFLILAAASGLPRATGRLGSLHRPALAVVGTAALLVAVGPLDRLTRRAAPVADYERALAHIHPGDRVMATDEVGPHLAHRNDLLLFPFALAPVAPAFPFPAAARSTTPETAAAVDAVVVGPLTYPEAAPAYLAFARSPYLADFPSVVHYGQVTVYRRTPG